VNSSLLKTIAWLVLLPYLMAGMGIATGPTVICYGEDGHVRIESTLNMCCEGPSGTLSQSTSSLYANLDTFQTDDTCGNCVDIPVLANATIAHLTSPPKSPLLIAALPEVGILISNKGEVNENPFVELEPPVNTTLSSLRTVVLLT
jgi:hypothetical protein